MPDETGKRTAAKAGYAFGVAPGEAFDRKIGELLGPDAVQYA